MEAPIRRTAPPQQTPAVAAPTKGKDRAPNTPPSTIKDSSRHTEYERVRFLGEGGFARVYEFRERRAGASSTAVKVVAKKSLQTTKTKTKLYAEIKLHKMMEHPNIVGFFDCFDDTDNVYMGLELCTNGSMMDLLRSRRRYTEPESRFYLTQLIGACQYMHSTCKIIHRDLKLGNLFLDAGMNLKVGDFGLAALIEKEGDRKKTICGTPNYIAPEVLFDTANGHSFEVDVWSTGVILYTLVVGKPPFQTKDVKAIYKRIRHNQYDFPPDKAISEEAQDLITYILTANPQERPTLPQILAHPFFTTGPFPSYIPVSALQIAPDHSHLPPKQWVKNFDKVRSEACMPGRRIKGESVRTSLGPSGEQQEREFAKAVMPGSPLSALLSSARQPLLVSPNPKAASSSKHSSSSSHSHGVSSTHHHQRGEARSSGRSKLASSPHHQNLLLAPLAEDDNEEEEGPPVPSKERDRELAAQKARIVAEMAGGRSPATDEGGMVNGAENQRVRRLRDDHRAEMPSTTSVSSKGKGRPLESHDQNVLQPHRSSSNRPLSNKSSSANVPPSGTTTTARTKDYDGSATAKSEKTSSRRVLGSFDVFTDNLFEAFVARDRETTYIPRSRDGRELKIPDRPEHPKVFIVAWVDYSDKYGMGYDLTDGTVGVHFNDSTSLVLAPNGTAMDYISQKENLPGVLVRKTIPTNDRSHDLKNKCEILRQFHNYMSNELLNERDYCFKDMAISKGMVFVQKYIRTKRGIIFKMSHDMIQFNFNDHDKILLSHQGQIITYISPNHELTTWSLQHFMSITRPSQLTALASRQSKLTERKFLEVVTMKLAKIEEMLRKIRTASEARAGESDENTGLTAGTARTR